MLHATGWSFIGMHLIWWVFWFGLITVAFSTVTPVPKSQLRTGERALDILRRRYAAGQLSTEDYERRKSILERDEPSLASATPAYRHH